MSDVYNNVICEHTYIHILDMGYYFVSTLVLPDIFIKKNCVGDITFVERVGDSGRKEK